MGHDISLFLGLVCSFYRIYRSVLMTKNIVNKIGLISTITNFRLTTEIAEAATFTNASIRTVCLQCVFKKQQATFSGLRHFSGKVRWKRILNKHWGLPKAFPSIKALLQSVFLSNDLADGQAMVPALAAAGPRLYIILNLLMSRICTRSNSDF